MFVPFVPSAKLLRNIWQVIRCSEEETYLKLRVSVFFEFILGKWFALWFLDTLKFNEIIKDTLNFNLSIHMIFDLNSGA